MEQQRRDWERQLEDERRKWERQLESERRKFDVFLAAVVIVLAIAEVTATIISIFF